MHPIPFAMLLTAAALTSCAPTDVTGALQVANGRTQSMRVSTPKPTHVVLEIWNDGPDAVELTRTDKEGDTKTTLTKGGAYKFEHDPTDVIAVDMVTTGEARVRYEARARADLTVSTIEK